MHHDISNPITPQRPGGPTIIHAACGTCDWSGPPHRVDDNPRGAELSAVEDAEEHSSGDAEESGRPAAAIARRHHQVLAAHLGAVGERLSSRIDALWPNLDDTQRAAIAAQTTEDDMRALLDAYEAGHRQPIYRTVYEIEVFSADPPATGAAGPTIGDDFGDDTWTGQLVRVGTGVVPAAEVRAQLRRTGNPPGFFDEILGTTEDSGQPL